MALPPPEMKSRMLCCLTSKAELPMPPAWRLTSLRWSVLLTVASWTVSRGRPPSVGVTGAGAGGTDDGLVGWAAVDGADGSTAGGLSEADCDGAGRASRKSRALARVASGDAQGE